ncbi:MAG: dockerin type I repeat-containing protein [Clostridia bacterium]
MLKKKRNIVIGILLILIGVLLVGGLTSFAPKSLATTELGGKEVWIDTNFNDENIDDSLADKLLDTIVFNDKLYVVSSMCDDSGETDRTKINVKSYDGESWENVDQPIFIESEDIVEQIAFCKTENDLYIFYSGLGYFGIKRLNSITETWIDVTEMNDVSGTFGFAVSTDIIYITVMNETRTVAKILVFDGTNLSEEKIYFQDNGYIEEPKAAMLNDVLYVGVRELGKTQITVYSYIDGVITNLNSTIEASTYTMTTLREKIYITTDLGYNGGLTIYTYDGNEWGEIDTGIDYGSPSMVIKENEVYVLTSSWVTDGKLRTYSYSKSTQEFVQEGEDVDDPAFIAQAIIYNDYIYTIYQNGTTGEIMAKRKEYVPDYYRGDINQDGRVSVADAIYGAKGLAGSIVLTDDQKAIGDVNDDGRFAVSDLIKIAKYLAGMIEVL